ncbi:ComEA family DNA-binding protein [Nocardioides sp. T2.26MG-1]|uniref:ComEA family DNA-binding protein n=1 Tax=Nocardioides sp. T2.26MG-1 TaxID=3041166 RepID=UPI00247789D1|nr:ComEA family DNA-binding protein [Nocardioides sp. T2.26MG-1]CAI9404612.1 hypothetical protein HIDPHFAB_04215 [Nocardioides sp. T2.26MG-1]
MAHRRPSPEHQEAVTRRLALLSAELTGDRPPLPPPPPPQAEPPPAPPVVPVPGRHAARRPGAPRSVAALVPPTLRGRVLLGPAQLTVVALVVALGLGVTCWWVVRGDADRLEAPALEPTTAALATQSPLADASPVAADAAASASASGASVTVDVAGRVRRPGIVVLDDGARVVDALEAAGGARPRTDLTGLNLARVLVDGEQIVVGQPPPSGVVAAAVPTPGAPGGPLVNLNTATQAELEALPQVGPVTAQAIMTWRDEHGGFTAVDELLEVDGIGDATLAQLAPYVTV